MQIKELREMWRELWWKMAGGKKSEYEKMKSTNVFEFWQLLDLWKKQTKAENEHLRARHNNRK